MAETKTNRNQDLHGGAGSAFWGRGSTILGVESQDQGAGPIWRGGLGPRGRGSADGGVGGVKGESKTTGGGFCRKGRGPVG